MRHALIPMRHALLAIGLATCTVTPVPAAPACFDAQRKVDEALALRDQARQEARIGSRERVCDTLDEIGDRYAEARDAFEDCGATVAAIGLRSDSRALRAAKAASRCD